MVRTGEMDAVTAVLDAVTNAGATRDSLLVRALADILGQAADSAVTLCDIVHETLSSDDAHAASASSPVSDEPTVISKPDTSLHIDVSSISNTEASSSQTAVKRLRLGHEQFHSSLR